MRNHWDHEAPEGHQPCPRDNTTRHVYAQVSRWLRTDEPVHPEIAMEIAAWWHGPGRLDTAVTAFSHTGDVKIHGIAEWDSYAGFGPDLGDAVRSLIAAPQDEESTDDAGMACLRALAAYVDAVEQHATRYRRSIWHDGGHRWMSTGTVDEDSCLTCGVHATLRSDSADGDHGSYFGGDGELIITCTWRTDLVHGSVRECEADNGRPCDEALTSDTGNCTHIDHVCNCLHCLN
jgi:hypothetical protein